MIDERPNQGGPWLHPAVARLGSSNPVTPKPIREVKKCDGWAIVVYGFDMDNEVLFGGFYMCQNLKTLL